MSAVFISHTSADSPVAGELNVLLAGAGQRSVFLDFDPRAGIPAGRDWERELYAQLRGCQAVVVLCSAHSVTSPWCFAEITHARALGKAIFPVRLDATPMWPLLTDLQVIDLTAGRQAGWQRLLDGLAAAGLDPAALTVWDGSRSPYPGLAAFEAGDAAVYFGRDAAIQTGLETLARLRRLGGPRLVLVLGASGSGKSSLVRAGIAPRLAREHGAWLVAAPFRPLANPLDGAAVALAALPGAPGWRAVRETLEAGDADTRRRLINDLRMSAGPEAGVVLVVDQLEEALDANAPPAEQAAFLRLLRSVAERRDGPLFILATLRSDFLGAFQTHPLMRGVAYEAIHLAQIALAEIGQVIEGPARVAGIELEPGLAQAMVADTTTDHALPLLAFTLRELHDRYTAELRRGEPLTIKQYREQLGGLQGAVARAAEALCEGRSAEELAALRLALFGLVRVDAEGRYVRRVRRWRELPQAAHAQLERFVTARLLTSHGVILGSADMAEADAKRQLEVAHETLFGSWQRLAAWLAADREFMLWRERLHTACATWQRNQRDASLLLRGPLLVEAQRWRGDRADDLDAEGLAFVDASSAQQRAEQAAHDRRRRGVVAALLGAVAVFGLLAAGAGWQWRVANDERSVAVARQLGSQASEAFKGDPVRGLLLTVLSLQSAWTADAHGALLERLDTVARARPTSTWKPHPGPIRAMALSPDGRWLATAGPGRLQLQSVDGAVRNLGSSNGDPIVQTVAFSPDGRALAAACQSNAVCVHDLAIGGAEPLRLPAAPGQVAGLGFGAGGSRLVAWHRGAKVVRVFAWPGGAEEAPLDVGEQEIEGMAVSHDGRWLAVSVRAGIGVWDLAGLRRLAFHTGLRRGPMAFSADGKYLCIGSDAPLGIVMIAERADGSLVLEGVDDNGGATRPWSTPSFSGDAKYLASFSDVQLGAQISSLTDFDRLLVPVPVGSLHFAASGRLLLVGGLDGRITEWDPDDKPAARIAHPDQVLAVALSADGRLLATAGTDGRVRLIDVRTARVLREAEQPVDRGGLGFSADGRWLAAVNGYRLWLLDVATLRGFGPFVHEAPVTAVRFDPGGALLATATRWDATPRFQVRRPTRIRVWEIATMKELGWRYDLDGDATRATSTAAKASLDAVRPVDGGDATVARQAMAWPLAYAADDLNFRPLTIEPTTPRLAARTPAGVTLMALARRRAESADVVEQTEGLQAFSADGAWLASAVGREARLWPLHVEALMAEACTRVRRNLSCAEWREALGDAPYAAVCPAQPGPPDAANCGAGSKR